MKILLTSGGTKVMIDRVRHIGNMSRGTFGAAIAKEFIGIKDVDLTFLMAEGSRDPLASLPQYAKYPEVITYKTFEQYEEKLMELLKRDYDYVILAAAVSDYVVDNYYDGKIRSKDNLTIKLKPAKKLISEVKKVNPKCKLVGFKLLVDSTDTALIEAAQQSAINNDCEFVVANDLRDIQNNAHKLLIVNKHGLVKTVNSDQNNRTHLAQEVVKMVIGE